MRAEERRDTEQIDFLRSRLTLRQVPKQYCSLEQVVFRSVVNAVYRG